MRKLNIGFIQAIDASGFKKFALAERAGLTVKRLWHITHCDKVPTPKEQSQLSEVLGVSVARFFKKDGASHP